MVRQKPVIKVVFRFPRVHHYPHSVENRSAIGKAQFDVKHARMELRWLQSEMQRPVARSFVDVVVELVGVGKVVVELNRPAVPPDEADAVASIIITRVVRDYACEVADM